MLSTPTVLGRILLRYSDASGILKLCGERASGHFERGCEGRKMGGSSDLVSRLFKMIGQIDAAAAARVLCLFRGENPLEMLCTSSIARIASVARRITSGFGVVVCSLCASGEPRARTDEPREQGRGRQL